MSYRLFYIFVLFIIPEFAIGQIGGKYTYEFLNLTNSARIAALGGKIVSIPDNDLNLPFHNPGLLSPEMDQNLVLNYVNYFADINFGYVSYSRTYNKIGSFAAGIHYINYGRFTAADQIGNITGSFTASEYAFNLIYSRPLPFDSLFNIGINLKPVISNFEKYTSFGLATDIGINYTGRQGLFSAGLVLKNIGFQIKPYYSGNSEPLPFEIQLGLSHKLKHAPFRFMVTAHHLETFKLAPEEISDPNQQDPVNTSDKPRGKFEQFGDNLIRHLVFGLELNPVKPVFIRLGYNPQRRKELQLSSRTGMVGFSWGFGIRISKFHLSYGRATYHLAGASNHFSLTLNLNEFNKKIP